jgi:hypothetical protein
MPRPPILISGPYRRPTTYLIRSVLLAVAIGVALGVAITLGVS